MNNARIELLGTRSDKGDVQENFAEKWTPNPFKAFSRLFQKKGIYVWAEEMEPPFSDLHLYSEMFFAPSVRYGVSGGVLPCISHIGTRYVPPQRIWFLCDFNEKERLNWFQENFSLAF